MTISDDELRRRLTALGCDVGPIDDTTRPLYVAMLKRREGAEKTGRQGKSATKAAQTWTGPSASSRTTSASAAKSRSSGRSRGRQSQVFSSDEEDRDRSPAATKRTPSYGRKSASTPSYQRAAVESDDSAAIPSSTVYSSGGTLGNFDAADSGESLFSVGLSPVRPETPSLPLLISSKYTRRPLHPTTSNYGNSGNNSFLSSTYSSNSFQPPGTGVNGFSDDDIDDHRQPSTSFYSRYSYKPLSIFTSARTKTAPYSSVSQSSYTAGGGGHARVLRRPPATQAASGGARSHFIPKLLVGITAIFFVALAVLYYRLGTESQTSSGAGAPDATEEIKRTECAEPVDGGEIDGEGYVCIRPSLFRESLDAAKAIQTLLANKKYEQLCGKGDDDLDNEGHLSYEKAASYINRALDDKIFISAVYLIESNPSWGVEIARGGTDAFLMPLYPAPLWCRLQRAAMQMLVQALLFIVLVALLVLTYWAIQNRKVNQRERCRHINGLIEDIVDLLTNNAADNPETPYLPILEIRDKLLPSAATSRSAAQLWREVEEKFEATECARVAREKQRVRGEWFQVWRWLPPPTLTNGQWGLGSKVWQGKAFDGSSAGRPLTNCLKIKNMFNKLEERGEGWVRDVERELLTKCGPNHGIVHMHVAEDSSDGIVYAKMVSLEAAGEVYRKLHGSWFDRRLVTAKYLREKRYHEKFPESIELSTQMEVKDDD